MRQRFKTNVSLCMVCNNDDAVKLKHDKKESATTKKVYGYYMLFGHKKAIYNYDEYKHIVLAGFEIID